MKKTPLYDVHVARQAKMVPFAGYAMPLNYGSQIAEHEAVRTDAGMFDVSHMMITDVSGADAKAFLRALISNDVNKLEKTGTGKALYALMMNDQGGIVDDLIVYLMPFGYRLVTNAGTRDKVTPWLADKAASFDVQLSEQTEFAMLAVQGPHAIKKVLALYPKWHDLVSVLKLFQGTECGDFFVARTGYTGEDGLEIMVPKDKAVEFWNHLIADIKPCGLAARDTLRLEAGMNLYGQDMDEHISPLECGLMWAVDLTDPARDFIGKATLLDKQKQTTMKQVGLILEDKGVLRQGYVVKVENETDGVITSGTFSPTLKQSIAIARVPAATKDKAFVDIRGTLASVRVVDLPFVKKGKILVK